MENNNLLEFTRYHTKDYENKSELTDQLIWNIGLYVIYLTQLQGKEPESVNTKAIIHKCRHQAKLVMRIMERMTMHASPHDYGQDAFDALCNIIGMSQDGNNHE